MDRSLGLRLGRPFGLALPVRPGAPSGAGARGTGARGAGARGAGSRGGRAGSGRSGAARPGRWALRERLRRGPSLARALRARRVRIAAIALLIGLPLLAGGWLWLRQSSLVAVEHVRINGLSGAGGAQSSEIETALRGAAQGMSTLDVNTSALRAAVSSFPIVRSVQAHASFPHAIEITVLEQPPVAALVVGGARTAVAADGVVLGPSYLSSKLPALAVGHTIASLPLPAASVSDGSLRQALIVLGDTPPALARFVERAYTGPKGLTIALRGALLAYFGDAELAHAKWLALTRVLADPGSTGASYIDVRQPDRAAAGFPPGTTRPDASGEAESTSGTDPATAAELAASLDAGVSGGTGASSAAGSQPEPQSGSSASGAGSEADGSTSGEAGATSSGETGSETAVEAPVPGG